MKKTIDNHKDLNPGENKPLRKKNYRITVEPDGQYWFIRIPALDEIGFTQARTLDEVDTMAHDLIEIVTGNHNFNIEQTVKAES
ncbi:hypothetical protein [Bifidobacterium sp. ESL0790]|uniref:hypothetical protein n=1 Tax=Bifidobacterium sp. ESL0790 TaxID=2983233 RepID=UPI0023F9BE81|nr:hypothetical protein [Bifidobacterium sp. ESL0790]WEV72756.1 hypothetical protein OZY47_01915 [Bifidobacterium sp. ESL0790]